MGRSAMRAILILSRPGLNTSKAIANNYMVFGICFLDMTE
jgi:hypothetical protein